MVKLDLIKQYKLLYQPSPNEVVFVDVPPLQFATYSGAIEPGHSPGDSPAFAHALEALYGISYTLKFSMKLDASTPVDYKVMPLEAFWWVEDGIFDITKPDNWHWKAVIMQPDVVTCEIFELAKQKLGKKKPELDLSGLNFETIHEGLCLQIMHIGPYATEPATVARMHDFAGEKGYIMSGRHHEIYLGDPRKAAPEKLKTILRHPVQRRSEG